MYCEDKAIYQATIRKEKFKPAKEYCNWTPRTNPPKADYKQELNKSKRSQTMATLGNLMAHLLLTSSKQ